MGTKNATFTLNPNQTQSLRNSTATFTGRTVYGTSVAATESIIQNAPASPGVVSVTPDGSGTYLTCLSGYCEFIITSSNINGNLSLSGTTNAVTGITDTSGNPITSVPGNTTVTVRVYFSANTNPNTGEANYLPRDIKLEASGTGTDGNSCSDTGYRTQYTYPASLTHIPGNGLTASTSGNNTYIIDSIEMVVKNNCCGTTNSSTYVWNNVGTISNGNPVVIGSPSSYQGLGFQSQIGQFDVYNPEITVTLAAGSAIPGGSISVLIPNAQRNPGTVNYFLYRQGTTRVYKNTQSHGAVMNTIHPSTNTTPIFWPNGGITVTLYDV